MSTRELTPVGPISSQAGDVQRIVIDLSEALDTDELITDVAVTDATGLTATSEAVLASDDTDQFGAVIEAGNGVSMVLDADAVTTQTTLYLFVEITTSMGNQQTFELPVIVKARR